MILSFFCLLYSLLAFGGFVFFMFADLYELGIAAWLADLIIAWCGISGFIAFVIGWILRLGEDVKRAKDK